MKLCSHFWFTMFLLLVVVQSNAQQHPFSELSVHFDNGPQTIRHLAVDSNGFLWLGTSNGVYRYDGVHATKIALPAGIDTAVSSLQLKGDTLFAGFASGAIAFINTHKLTCFYSDTALCSVPITDISATGLGVYVCTYGNGLYVYKKGTARNIGYKQGLSDLFTYHAQIGPNGLLWVATDRGIHRISLQDEKVVDTLRSAQGLPDNLVLSIVKQGGMIWIGSQSKGITLTQNGKAFSEPVATDAGAIRFMKVTSDGIIAGTQKGGLLEYHIGENSNLVPEGSWRNPGKLPIRDAILDGKGNIITCDGSDVLHVIDTRITYWEQIDGISMRNISAIDYYKGKLFIAQDSSILELNEQNHHLASVGVARLTRDMNKIVSLKYIPEWKQLWAGTFDDGLETFKNENGKWSFFAHFKKGNEGLINNNIFNMANYRGRVWLATIGGMQAARNNSGDIEFEHIPSFPSNVNYVYDVYSTAGQLWIGTDGSGLLRFHNGKFDQIGGSNDPFNKIYSITGNNKEIWVATSAGSVVKLDERGQNFREFTIDQGKVKINAVSMNQHEKVLVSADKGYYFLLPGESTARKISLLKNDEASRFLNTLSVGSQGVFWTATANYLMKIKLLTPAAERPSMYITGLNDFLAPLDSTQSHTLNHDQNSVGFSFTALWFRNPSNIRYKYRLKGWEEEWVTSSSQQVIYPKLPPGTYTFEVMAGLDEDFSHAVIKKYSFHILTPVYTRWWFISGTIILLLIFGYYALRTREEILRRRERAQREKIQSQFDVLRNQVNPHFLFNTFNTLAAIIPKDQDKAVNYVENLSDFFRVVLDHRMRDIISLKEELHLVENYLYLQKMRYGDNLSVSVEIPEKYLSCSIPPLTLQMLFENAIKHNVISSQIHLKIRLYAQDQWLVVENDLHPKSQREPSSGIGVENIKNRFNILFKRDIVIEQTDLIYRTKIPVIFT